MKRYAGKIGTALLFIAFINFAAFCIVAVSIGGDAINGRIENGHYYLASHGQLTEVSPEVWTYSKYHAISVFITHPIGILVGGGLMEYSRRKAPSEMQRK
jgi:hypothetical protein